MKYPLLALSLPLHCLSAASGPVPSAPGPSIELRGNWMPGAIGDGSFDLDLSIAGGSLDGTRAQLGLWLFDNSDWDEENERPSTTPLLDAQVTFPWSMHSEGLPYSESGEANTIYLFIERGPDEFHALVTVPVKTAARFFEYAAPVPKTIGTQPRVMAKTGFKEDGSGDLLFDLGVGDDDELFLLSVPEGEQAEEVWIWSYTPEMPAGWPVPDETPSLHHTASPTFVDGEYTMNVNADLSGLSTTILWPNRNVYLYAMVAVDDGTGPLKYYQYKTTADIKATDGGAGEFNAFRMKPNPIGIAPK